MKTEFSTFDISKALKGIPQERLREWINKGFITASTPAEGQGTKALFTFNDVYCVALFRDLIEHGYSRKTAKEYVKAFMKTLKKEKDDLLHHKTVYILYRVFVRDGKETDEALLLNEGAWKMDLQRGNIDWNLTDPKKFSEAYLPPLKESTEWKLVHIVNFGKLRKEVDGALKGL